ncbi:hypothetical protein PU629_12005 [Pullulanibacillus sp. KACC 23026]|uniref:hypothetical protein n=1 Tax=Pullulanibacillus sp. KACC 23026 TaxID=3028315 RepID=UPI0023B0FCAE|nr:hypothetical protein [Pullulanibacillus sp. KACC 23026]WEG10902.1 hypothetical protein PU629_12005 [Pullulanibacillus sp. KACC 23026]
MAKDEKLNEEAAPNNNNPLSASTEDLIFLNELNDHNKYLPKSKDRTIKKKNYLE